MELFIYLLSALLFVSFLWIIVNGLFYPSFQKPDKVYVNPLVSILVPMRDEERNVLHLIENLTQLTFPNLEIILLDDHSSDATYSLALGHINKDSRFSIIQGAPLKKGWAGKVHACYQLSLAANGDYLLFLDADARLKKNTIEKMLPFFRNEKVGLVTGFPHFPVTSWLSKLLVPMQHFVIWLHLPLGLANYSSFKPASAAHGAFMFFERSAYDFVEGHFSVKSSIVEDVHLARVMKEHGFQVKLINATPYVTCHMYETNREVWNGFLKNIYIGIGKSPVMVTVLTIFYSLFYVLPLFLAFLSPIYGIWFLVPLVLVWMQKLYIDLQTGQLSYLFLFMPLSALAFLVILHASMWKSLKKQHYIWKGRAYK
ncbi:glycosyl transferase family 2 [Bacillus sp. LL01]|uniref:glycosyltransferase n=1 Tax=Bacillus sp. LL01 TaxID=1665556 RepID=UPI00064D1532|nr:glycosyltransferase family 2 protein [Bacillus sp. LL01]KMJ57853.1 glycosyl transferase family 2 [Bacillus sp. LL01]